MLEPAPQKLLAKMFEKFHPYQSYWCCKARMSCWGSSLAVAPAPIVWAGSRDDGTNRQACSSVHDWRKLDAAGDLLLCHEKLMKHTAETSELWINYWELCIIFTTAAATPVVQCGSVFLSQFELCFDDKNLENPVQFLPTVMSQGQFWKIL